MSLYQQLRWQKVDLQTVNARDRMCILQIGWCEYSQVYCSDNIKDKVRGGSNTLCVLGALKPLIQHYFKAHHGQEEDTLN